MTDLFAYAAQGEEQERHGPLPPRCPKIAAAHRWLDANGWRPRHGGGYWQGSDATFAIIDSTTLKPVIIKGGRS